MEANFHTLQVARAKVAHWVLADPEFVPNFERIELETAVGEAGQDEMEHARAVVTLQ
ncbi:MULTISPECIES: hypothetical protein [unclassified Roseovarius]|uniref:hypothetical protein n=1 Tax=unclassified Roseovarius TaxID=2614913 RepID=UPI00273F5B0F|nr:MULTISPECIES: hypothetical protein [unclassified Roseovarius]